MTRKSRLPFNKSSRPPYQHTHVKLSYPAVHKSVPFVKRASSSFSRHYLATLSVSLLSVDLVLRQFVLLSVIVVLVLAVVFLLGWAVSASRLVDAVVDAGVANALAAAVVEPAVARRTHALAGLTALVPRVAVRHERDGAVHRHHVRFQGVAHLLAVV